MSDEIKVRLRLAPEQTGRVVGAVIGGKAYVRWDAGGGHSVSVDALEQIDVAQDKAWPPKNMETK